MSSSPIPTSIDNGHGNMTDSQQNYGNNLMAPQKSKRRVFMGTPQTGFAEKMVSKSIIALKQRFDNNKPSRQRESRDGYDDSKETEMQTSIIIDNNYLLKPPSIIDDEKYAPRSRAISAMSVGSLNSFKTNVRSVLGKVYNDAAQSGYEPSFRDDVSKVTGYPYTVQLKRHNSNEYLNKGVRESSSLNDQSVTKDNNDIIIQVKDENDTNTSSVVNTNDYDNIRFGLSQDWDTHAKNRAVGWYELFTDLIFVLIIIKTTSMWEYLWSNYKNDYLDLIRILLEVIVFHFAFFVIWLEMAVISTRFISNKRIYIIMKYLYYTGVITMAMQVDDTLPSNHSYQFSIGLLICFSIYLVIHIHLCTIPRASLYCLVNICTVIVSISILLIGITRNKGSIESNNIIRMVCIFISTGVLYARTASTFAVSAGQIPVNVHHLAERFGLLMMLFIGESIISLLLTEYQYTLKYYYIIHLGFLNIYLIRFIYFNLAHAESKHVGDTHALRNAGKPGSIWFVNAHVLLSFCLIGEAMGLKLIVKDLKYSEFIDDRNVIFWITSHILVQLIMLFIRHTHQKVRTNMLAYIHLFTRIIFTPALFYVLPRITNDILILVTLIVFTTLVLATFDVMFIKCMKKIAKQNDDSKVHNYGASMAKIRMSVTNIDTKNH